MQILSDQRARTDSVAEIFPGPDHHIRVPDGTYRAKFIGSIGFYFMGRSPRVALCFQIPSVSSVEDRIFAFYKVKVVKRDGRKLGQNERAFNPEFEIGWRSRLSRDLGTLFSEISPSALPTKVPTIVEPVEIQTATVFVDQDGYERPEALKSSKVERIIGWAS